MDDAFSVPHSRAIENRPSASESAPFQGNGPSRWRSASSSRLNAPGWHPSRGAGATPGPPTRDSQAQWGMKSRFFGQSLPVERSPARRPRAHPSPHGHGALRRGSSAEMGARPLREAPEALRRRGRDGPGQEDRDRPLEGGALAVASELRIAWLDSPSAALRPPEAVRMRVHSGSNHDGWSRGTAPEPNSRAPSAVDRGGLVAICAMFHGPQFTPPPGNKTLPTGTQPATTRPAERPRAPWRPR